MNEIMCVCISPMQKLSGPEARATGSCEPLDTGNCTLVLWKSSDQQLGAFFLCLCFCLLVLQVFVVNGDIFRNILLNDKLVLTVQMSPR